MNFDRPSVRQDDFVAVCAQERPRLVRLCALLTGHPDAAEDLAQETLIEAWRGADTLRDEAKLVQWLSGIARNVCRRWAQRQRGSLVSIEGAVELPHPGGGLEIELERDELAMLLDRALGLLPTVTRDVLIAHFIEERPYAEIAARLGLSEGAVTVRIHRGKLALRSLLAGPELVAAAGVFGISPVVAGEWRQTRIVCPFCGRHSLLMRQDQGGGLWYRCAGSCIPTGTILGGQATTAVLQRTAQPEVHPRP